MGVLCSFFSSPCICTSVAIFFHGKGKEKLFLVFFVPLWFKAFKQKKGIHKFDAKDQFCGCPVLLFIEFAGADFVSSFPSKNSSPWAT